MKRKTAKKKSPKSSTDSDDSDESKKSGDISPSKGRKNIRKILDDKELDIQTKTAIAAERERRKRIAENQQKYNNSLIEQSSSLPDEQTPDADPRLILELDKTTNEPLIEVSLKLVEQMKPHQCDGVRFLWNNLFESLDAIRNKKHSGNGCILAHCMGLGKTLQVISFIHTVFNYSDLTNVKTCLVLCPINAGKTF
jgi:transcriptional regulator ATRX